MLRTDQLNLQHFSWTSKQRCWVQKSPLQQFPCLPFLQLLHTLTPSTARRCKADVCSLPCAALQLVTVFLNKRHPWDSGFAITAAEWMCGRNNGTRAFFPWSTIQGGPTGQSTEMSQRYSFAEQLLFSRRNKFKRGLQDNSRFRRHEHRSGCQEVSSQWDSRQTAGNPC